MMKKLKFSFLNGNTLHMVERMRNAFSVGFQYAAKFAKQGIRSISSLSKAGFRAVQGHWEAVRYYGALTIVLIALATFSYTQRSGSLREDVQIPKSISDSPAVAQAVPEPTAEPEPSMQRPIEGEIVGVFCADSLEWNESLGQWQTHAAIDFSAVPGEAIFAIADGVVLDAYWDPLYGNVVVVDHGDGRTAHYGSLNTLELVEVGDQIKRGEILSAAGECPAEEHVGTHLHFEYYENGAAVDFSTRTDE